jgi:hypothetical protein
MEINYLTYIFLLFAGVFKGLMDLLSFRYNESVFSNFNKYYWNAEYSWSNKWKNNNPANGERFPLSSTILVFVTDGWHLFQWIFLKFIFLSILFYSKQENIYYMIIDFFFLFSYYVGFWLSYESKLFKK